MDFKHFFSGKGVLMQKPKAYMGIDPGQTGAAALISNDGIDCFDWPGDASAFAGEIRQWCDDYDIAICILEKVGAMPKQGVSSMFKFGRNAGMIEGVLAALNIPYDLQRPQQWQRGLIYKDDGTDNKSRALAAARRLYPNVDFLRRKKDHGRAEALLMAHVAFREGK